MVLCLYIISWTRTSGFEKACLHAGVAGVLCVFLWLVGLQSFQLYPLPFFEIDPKSDRTSSGPACSETDVTYIDPCCHRGAFRKRRGGTDNYNKELLSTNRIPVCTRFDRERVGANIACIIFRKERPAADVTAQNA